MSRRFFPQKCTVAKMTALALANTETVASAIGDVLRQCFHEPKSLARVIDTDPRAARNWLDGRNLPQTTKMLQLMASNDDFYAAINELIGRAQHDPLSDEAREHLTAALDLLAGKRGSNA